MDKKQRTGAARMPRAQRKQLKQRARWSVKQHYGVMLSVCLLAILLGTEFTGSLDFLKVQTPTDVKVDGRCSRNRNLVSSRTMSGRS